MPNTPPYQGVESGPIRPPSEADSLCLRVTRNCPWNRCTFCPVYKNERFSLRPVEEVIQDIDTLFRHTESLRALAARAGELPAEAVRALLRALTPEEHHSFRIAQRWWGSGMSAVFLQDADSLVIRPAALLRIVEHLKKRFPQVRRITSYARSHTLARKRISDLQALREAGLNRLHLGLESGSDAVLARVKKGATQALHITAGQRVKAAGIELSEYYMPGLGGQDLSEDHARASAEALNQIDPDFIRLRTLALPPQAPLFAAAQAGDFQPCTEVQVIEELRRFLESLHGISSTVTSDHALNLLPAVQGRLPQDQAAMLQTLDEFLGAEPERQRRYQIGRRKGFLTHLNQLAEPGIEAQARALCQALGVTAHNADAISHALLLQQGL